MQSYHDKAMDTMVKGWTRIDMLLALYGRTIASFRAAKSAKESGDIVMLGTKCLEANRLLLGLHSGLNTDEYPIAVNVARLLNFVSLRLEEQNFDEGVYFLEKLQNSFSQVRDEAAELERSGKIPPLVNASSLDTTA